MPKDGKTGGRFLVETGEDIPALRLEVFFLIAHVRMSFCAFKGRVRCCCGRRPALLSSPGDDSRPRSRGGLLPLSKWPGVAPRCYLFLRVAGTFVDGRTVTESVYRPGPQLHPTNGGKDNYNTGNSATKPIRALFLGASTHGGVCLTSDGRWRWRTA